MKKRIYHGSPTVIPMPLLSKGKANNDYGRGFYCTEDVEMAREWACKGTMPPGFVNGFVNAQTSTNSFILQINFLIRSLSAIAL